MYISLITLVVSTLFFMAGVQVYALDQQDDSNSIDSGSGEQKQSVLTFPKEKSTSWIKRLQMQLNNQEVKQRITDKDRMIFEKWLVDNINDLHRELKQTESDFEHYVQVTKNIMERNEQAKKLSTGTPLVAALYLAPLSAQDLEKSSIGIILSSTSFADLSGRL